MKPIRMFVSIATVAMLAMPLVPALAQSPLSTGNGIAASPKVQQMLSERSAIVNTGHAMGGATVSDTSCCQDSCCGSATAITASPKVQQTLAERSAKTSCDNGNQSGQGTIALAAATCVKCCN